MILPFLIEIISFLLGFIFEKLPFFKESSGLKNIELITLIPSFAKILIIALIITGIFNTNFSKSLLWCIGLQAVAGVVYLWILNK